MFAKDINFFEVISCIDVKEYCLSSIEFRKIKQNDPFFMEILALRYKVYCVERGFEKKEDHPYGLECDKYDAHAVHFAAISKHTQKVVGTVRLILYAGGDFPAEHSFELTQKCLAAQRECVGEVSRLALSRSCCCEFQAGFQPRSNFNTARVVNGLLRCLAQESMERGISHLYAVMARGLPIILAREKIFFLQIGPEKDYHGLRAPYLGVIKDVINRNPEFFSKRPSHQQFSGEEQ